MSSYTGSEDKSSYAARYDSEVDEESSSYVKSAEAEKVATGPSKTQFDFSPGKVQPFRAYRALLGINDAPPGYCDYLYSAIVFLLCAGHPACLIVTAANSAYAAGRFSVSSLGGMAALACAAPLLFPFLHGYVRQRESKRATDVLLALGYDEGSLRRIVVAHAIPAIIASVLLSAYWIVAFIFSLEKIPDDDKTVLIVVHSVCAFANVSVFVMAVATLLLVTNFHRNQAVMFTEIALKKTKSLRDAAYLYNMVIRSMHRTNSVIAAWTAPIAASLLFSFSFQGYGHLNEELSDENYNGIYYAAATVVLLLVVVLFATSVTRKFRWMDSTVSTSYTVYDTGAYGDVTPFVAMVGLTTPPFKVAGAPALPELFPAVMVGVMGLVGYFLRAVV